MMFILTFIACAVLCVMCVIEFVHAEKGARSLVERRIQWGYTVTDFEGEVVKYRKGMKLFLGGVILFLVLTAIRAFMA
jgi:hypothetical protein